MTTPLVLFSIDGQRPCRTSLNSFLVENGH